MFCLRVLGLTIMAFCFRMHPGKGVCASLRLFVALAGCFGLVACSELNLASYVFKEAAGPSLSGKGGYKVGRPYEINGVWYTPAEDYNYSETGIASWYGAAFHGKSTANGEIFNQSDVTAAHRTLPMPCFVRVTNLGNGRSLVVRVNDRGPFAHGRIIDLSRRSAQLLGFEREGTARVRVEIMAKESRALAMQLQGATAKKSSSSPVRPVAVDQTVKQGNATATQMFLQAGAFSRYENASRLSAALSFLGRTSITEVETAKGKLFRVRMGPIASLDDADRLLETIISSGSPGARIVVD